VHIYDGELLDFSYSTVGEDSCMLLESSFSDKQIIIDLSFGSGLKRTNLFACNSKFAYVFIIFIFIKRIGVFSMVFKMSIFGDILIIGGIKTLSSLVFRSIDFGNSISFLFKDLAISMPKY